MSISIRPWIQLVASTLETIAPYTSSTLDDRAAAFCRLALSNDAVMDLIDAIINNGQVVANKDAARNEAISAAFAESATPAAKEAIAATGIDIAALLNTILPLIIRLILTQANKR